MKKAVILVSGGADSITVMALALQMNYEIYAISINYSQRNNIELEKIKESIKTYKVKQHKIINIDLQELGGSALTDNEIKVPKYNSSQDIGDEIPVTYVPARNTIFLSYALGYAEIIGSTDIFIGVHATDYANYPDCRPEYLKAFEKMANLATAIGISSEHSIKIHAPLINMTKGQIIATGLKLGVDYSKTISCYDPEDDLSCGTCHACLVRLKAFEENNSVDPIRYIK